MKTDIFTSDQTILSAVDKMFDDRLDTFRLMNEQIIWRNLLYYEGEQYIEFLRSTKSFRRRSIPDYVPTPVSNEIREYVRAVKAMLLNQKMFIRVWPNTNEKEDEQGAAAGQNLLTWLDGSNDAAFFDEKEKLTIWLPISGTAFMRTFPDSDGGMWIPDGGKTGSVGRECILPFNVRLDTLGDILRKKRWVGVQFLKDKEWVEDTFKMTVEKSESDKGYIDYQKSLAKLIGNVSPWKGQSIVAQQLDEEDDNLVIVREIEFQPTAKYPKGRFVSACGNKVLQKQDRLPIKATDDYWDYSLTDFHYNYVPGRFWSSGGVNDLISPQNTINEIDQALSINRKGMGRPKIISPGDVGLKKIGLGGHGFVALTYNPIMGQKPEFKEGTPLPAQVLDERLLQKQEVQNASGDPKNILKGQQPSANASGILTDVLRETAERGKYPDLDRFNRSMARVYKKALLVAQEVMTEERILKITGRGNKVKVFKFKASDLRNNTDVKLEPDSGLLTTNSGKSQMIINMIQAGFFKEGEVSPTLRQEVLSRMGMSGFSEEMNNDVERAEDENSRVASGDFSVMLSDIEEETGETQVYFDDPLFDFDNHEQHFEAHRKFIISPEFAELPKQIQTVLMSHANLHQQRIEMKPPDIRDYVQIDKLLAANVLSAGERAQILEKYLGVEADASDELGMPTADVALKAKQKNMDTEIKESSKADQMDYDLIKHTMTETGKANATQAQVAMKKMEGNKPRPSSNK